MKEKRRSYSAIVGAQTQISTSQIISTPGKMGHYLVEFETGGLYTPIISVRGEKANADAWPLKASEKLGSHELSIGRRSSSLPWVTNPSPFSFPQYQLAFQGVFLVYIGLNMLETDMQNSRNRAQLQQERAKLPLPKSSIHIHFLGWRLG